MDEKQPTQAQLKQLYDAAETIKRLGPWRWMSDSDLFGIIDPKTEEICMVSVMGTLGEHLSIALYIGTDAIHNILQLYQDADDERGMEVILTSYHLQASFEDYIELDELDVQHIETLGLSYAGEQAWPQFRSYQPGFAPYYLTADEADLLTSTLEQLAEMAPRWPDQAASIPDPQSGRLLVRQQEDGAWQDSIVSLPGKMPLTSSVEIKVDPDALAFLKQLQPQPMILEADCSMLLSMSVGDEGERPIIPYTFLVVDHQNGMALGSEVLDPSIGLNEMWSMIPNLLLTFLAQARTLPEKIWTKSVMLQQVCSIYTDELGITIELVPDLPMLNHARSMMMHYLGGADNMG